MISACDFGFTNSKKEMDAAKKFREDAIADGWSCEPIYGDLEPASRAAKLKRGGFTAHIFTRDMKAPCKWKYEVKVSVWGPDRLAILAPVNYSWKKLQAGVRTCNDCGATDVDTMRVSFAGRVCNKCLPAARKYREFAGWTS